MSVSGVRCAGLRSAAAFGTAGIDVAFIARNPTELVGLLAWHQPHVIRHVVVIGDDHAALRIDRDAAPVRAAVVTRIFDRMSRRFRRRIDALRSEEHTSELQSLMRRSYAVFCLNKKKSDK